MVTLGSIERGCGMRVAGGLYGECRTSREGMPIEYFIVDPPRVLDHDMMQVSAMGVTSIMSSDGKTSLLDWVGADSYPNVADFIEEAGRFGLSRRIPKSFDTSKLGQGSQIILIHSRAIVDNWQDVAQRRSPITVSWKDGRGGEPDYRCPKQYVLEYLAAQGIDVADRKERVIAAHHHGLPGFTTPDSLPVQCASLWWEDIKAHAATSGSIVRSMPSFVYEGYASIPNATHRPGVFLKMPLTNLVVIKDKEGAAEELVRKVQANSGLPVSLEEE